MNSSTGACARSRFRWTSTGCGWTALAASDARAVFLTPAHQFPTGVVLAPQRRRELLTWAVDAELVIEDDYDAEYRYDRAPVPALHAAAPDRIAYAGSISKSLAPALRLGWLVPPRRRYSDLVAAKHASDLGSPTVPQLVLARLLESGEYDRHIRLVRARHRARRDALLGALTAGLPAASVTGVAAGLHLLITLPDGVDDVALADELRDAGVLVPTAVLASAAVRAGRSRPRLCGPHPRSVTSRRRDHRPGGAIVGTNGWRLSP